MMLGKNLIAAAGNGIATGDVAEAIDFDGTNDALSRSSLTGNADSKTLTCSIFFYAASITGTDFLVSFRNNAAGQHFAVKIANNAVYIDGGNASATAILAANTPTSPSSIALNTWNHVLISIDLANTSNRSIYINDVAQSVTWSTYTNDSIAFSTNADSFRINALSSITGGVQGRLSNVFLDYTYRDLSVEANRRLFVTADLKPAAGQAALNPILYLPMSDPTQPGLNQGTGGNFTLTGTVARSGRGPNQYNAPYSDFDGSADYLSRTTAPTGIADGKTFTLSFVVNMDATISNYEAFTIRDGANQRLYVRFQSPSSLSVAALDSSPAYALLFTNVQPSGGWVAGRNYHVVMSFDVSNTGKRWVYINGEAVSVTYTNYANLNIDFLGASPDVRVGSGAGSLMNGRLGALWFNTSYIDLSVAANLAKFVTGTGIDAKPVDLGASGELPTGTSPLIYLPMYGNNAGKNYGTGGDFTVNSGPYTGARGPNEFWGNKADFDGSTGYLSRTTALGLSDGKTFSMAFWYKPDSSSAANYIYYTDTSGGSARVYVLRDASNNLNIVAKNSAGTNVLDATVTTGVFSSTATAKCIQICIDLTSTSLRKIYVDGVNQTAITWTTYTNDNINWNVQNTKISRESNGLNGKLSEFYFTTDYIDFSQESNRLKFRDAFGNPVDLTQQIEAAAIPNPAIYMRFPPTSFGTNSGTGGDFTVNGVISDGGQL